MNPLRSPSEANLDAMISIKGECVSHVPTLYYKGVLGMDTRMVSTRTIDSESSSNHVEAEMF
jgi:hypothetical protein